MEGDADWGVPDGVRLGLPEGRGGEGIIVGLVVVALSEGDLDGLIVADLEGPQDTLLDGFSVGAKLGGAVGGVLGSEGAGVIFGVWDLTRTIWRNWRWGQGRL